MLFNELTSGGLRLSFSENKLEIHAGIPGPATLKTLFSYALFIRQL